MLTLTLTLAGLLGCSGAGVDTSDTANAASDYAAAGAYSVGRHTATLDDTERDRVLTVEAWYPSSASSASTSPITDLIPDEGDRAAYGSLLAAAPAGCAGTEASGVLDGVQAAPRGEGWPLVVMSHCHDCARWSTVTVAERLASWGFVVVAPDHAGNTLFDALAGTGLPLDTDTLAVREGDVNLVLSAALAGQLVDDLVVDAGAVGVFGHSFGAVTVGMVLQDLPATGQPIQSAMFVGAPPENPFLPGVLVENLDAPLLFEVLAEDHSVGEAGNILIEGNYADATGPAWLVTLADAGHFSPSDLDGITGDNVDFSAGCGEDTRESTGEAFGYMDPADGRSVSASIATAFFAHTLRGETDGADWLAAAPDRDDRVSVESR